MKLHLKKFSFVLLAALMLTSCSFKKGSADTEANKTVDYANIQKPDKITLMSVTFVKDKENLKAIQEQYKKDTGIELVVNQIEQNGYYEKVNVCLAADDKIDAMEVGSVYYPSAAMYNLLWDMSDIYEQSEVKDKVDNYYVDALRINDRLYGFPLSKGGGTMTYVRTDWLKELGLSEPKNYTEFYNMLKAFKTKGNDIIPLTAAGLIGSESPYTTYLPEFYQDANPDIYLKDGKYVDGMSEPNMKDALERLRQAYTDGLMDTDITKNKTSDCRKKFYAGKVAVFNYWAGNWANTLQTNLTEQIGPEATVGAIHPIEETQYIERPPVALVIPKTCKNPEGVFKYLIEYMHDVDKGEILFSLGIEGKNYKLKNGVYDDVTVGAYYTPELSLAKNPLPININKRITDSIKLFNETSKIADLPVISEGSGSILPELSVIKKETIESVVTGEMTIDEGLADYEKRTSKMVKRALDDLNSSVNKSDDSSKEE